MQEVTPRLARFLATAADDDPIKRANRLIDEALAAQDRGDFHYGDALLATAERIMEKA